MARPRPAVKCIARRSSDGEPCQNYAIYGGQVCSTHGGSAPQVRRAAERRVEAAKVTAAAERFAEPRRGLSAAAALSEELERTQGRIDHLEERILTGDPETIITSTGAPHPLVLLEHTERRHLVDVGRAIASSGADEKRGELAVAQAALINRFGRSVLAITLDVLGASLTQAQQVEVGRRVASEMRAIGAVYESIQANSTPVIPAATA